MERKKLLKVSLEDNKNVSDIIDDILEVDSDMIKFKIQNLEQELKTAQRNLKKRLKETAPIDESVIEVLYYGIKKLESQIKLYNEFQTEYFS